MADTVTVEEFRARAREWLAANASRFEGLTDRFDAREYRRALWDAGLLGITLDPAYGGQGLTDDHQRAWDEEASRYTLPRAGEPVTTGICAPTLLDFGSEEQKERHIPRMLRGDETWTQLLSEPNAGSDLAGLQTRAVRDGDEYVITGQKVWTSGAKQAHYALCVARTNPDVPKHKGISMFIVPLQDTPGVDIRPLREMTGEALFNEVFLDGVRVPASNLVGEENDGWRALLAMLTHERLALGAGTGAGGSGASWAGADTARFIELARRRDLSDDPTVRQELAKLYTAEKVLGFLGAKMRDEIAAGVNVGSKGSAAKLLTASLARQSSNLGMVLAGPASQAWDPSDPDGGTYAHASAFSPMRAIAGGTSEIQRNTLGERVLGLPREPQPDKDLAFKDMLQN